MKRQVFVTAAHEDRKYQQKIMRWGNQGKLGNGVFVLPLDDDQFYYDDGELDYDRLSWALKNSALVVVIAGDDSYDHPWLDWEGEFCHQWGIKRVIMRVPNSNDPLPEEFSVLREIAFNPNAIEKEIRPEEQPSYY